MTEKQITSKQHFVPKFYMKKFADSNNFLQVLDLKQGMLIKKRPFSSVCYEKFFYAQKTGKQDEVSQKLEELFNILENDIAKSYNKIFQKIIANERINDEERYSLSTFASMLWLRGGYMRKQINKGSEDMMKQMMLSRASHPNFADHIRYVYKEKNGKEVTDDEVELIKKTYLDKSYRIKFDNATHINLIIEYRGFANMFHAKNWRIYLAKGEKKFIMSENPVIEWFPEQTSAYGTSFLERKHYLVLGPEVLVEMIYPISGKNLKRKVVGDDEVFEFNRLRAEYSSEYCYFSRKEELEDLIRYRKKRMSMLSEI